MSNNNKSSLSHKTFVSNKHTLRPTNYVKSWIEKQVLRGKRYKVKVLYIENPPLSSYSQDHQNQLHIHPQQSGCKYILGFDAETGFWIVDDGGEL